METFYILASGLIYMFMGFLVYLMVIGWSLRLHPGRPFQGGTMDFLVTLLLWPGVFLGLVIAVVTYAIRHMRS